MHGNEAPSDWVRRWSHLIAPGSTVLEAFDVPKRVVCVTRRDTTNTPLQALVLLNGPQFVEASRALAERLQREHTGDPAALVTAGLCSPVLAQNTIKEPPPPTAQHDPQEIYFPHPACHPVERIAAAGEMAVAFCHTSETPTTALP